MSQALRLRLLMIEDSDDDATLVLAAFAHSGYVVSATRVDEANALAAALRSGSWDLVSSDWCLPRFSGPAAIAMARERLPEVPIIVVSGTSDPATRDAALQAGAVAFVSKDDLAQLGPTVSRALSRSRPDS